MMLLTFKDSANASAKSLFKLLWLKFKKHKPVFSFKL